MSQETSSHWEWLESGGEPFFIDHSMGQNLNHFNIGTGHLPFFWIAPSRIYKYDPVFPEHL